jgi:tetratricopeptide (TPR) repeat protein
MKTRFAVLALGMIMITGGLKAQNSDKFGSDPDACKRNYSIYKEFYKQRNYKDALPAWNKTIEICPQFTRGLWSDGEKIFKTRIEETEDQVKKEELIDSLMWIYDERIKYFGNDPRYPEGYILGNKGISLLRYRQSEVQKGYEILGKSIELQGSATAAPILLTYMQVSRQLFIDGFIDAGAVLKDYEKVMTIVDEVLSKTPNDADFQQAKEGIEMYFSNSGAADCEALSNLYQPQLEENKTNEEWLRKITKQLRKAGCSDGQLFYDASEALFVLNPDADAAHNLAAMFLNQQDYEQAKLYLEKSIELGQESEELADMYYELAQLNYGHFKDYQTARNQARKAIEIRPNWGEPHILIGKIYIASREQVFDDPFDRSTVFWAAVDQFIIAKNKDPEVAAEANDLIGQFSKYFPNNEVVFFHTLKEGDAYKVGGWINENTTVRSSKL